MSRAPASNQIKIVCTPKSLPRNLWVSAAEMAVKINPIEIRPQLQGMALMQPGFVPGPDHLAAITKKIWHTAGAAPDGRFPGQSAGRLAQSHSLSHERLEQEQRTCGSWKRN